MIAHLFHQILGTSHGPLRLSLRLGKQIYCWYWISFSCSFECKMPPDQDTLHVDDVPLSERSKCSYSPKKGLSCFFMDASLFQASGLLHTNFMVLSIVHCSVRNARARSDWVPYTTTAISARHSVHEVCLSYCGVLVLRYTTVTFDWEAWGKPGGWNNLFWCDISLPCESMQACGTH